MRKIIAFAIAILLILSMVLPASAATVGGWDMGAAQNSINKAATEIVSKPDFDWSDWLNNLFTRFRWYDYN